MTTTVTFEGSGVRATLFGEGETIERAFTIKCASPIDSVRFDGTGDARITGPAPTVTGDIVLLDKQSDTVTIVDDTDLILGESIRAQIDTPNGSKNVTVVGVGIHDGSGYYVHPQFNSTGPACSLDTPNRGGTVTEQIEPSWTCPNAT